MGEEEGFIVVLAGDQSWTGRLAVNIFIYTGNNLKLFKGAGAATLGTVLPSFLMILAIAIFFSKIYDNPYVIAIFNGIRPAVVALIVVPVISTAKSAKLSWRNLWIPVGGALLLWLVSVSPVYIILGAAVYSLLYKFISDRR